MPPSPRYYILRGRQIVPVEMLEWARWLETAGEARVIGRDRVGAEEISTAFVGMVNPLFSTVVFHDNGDQEEIGNWNSLEEAEFEHRRTVSARQQVQLHGISNQTEDRDARMRRRDAVAPDLERFVTEMLGQTLSEAADSSLLGLLNGTTRPIGENAHRAAEAPRLRGLEANQIIMDEGRNNQLLEELANMRPPGTLAPYAARDADAVDALHYLFAQERDQARAERQRTRVWPPRVGDFVVPVASPAGDTRHLTGGRIERMERRRSDLGQPEIVVFASDGSQWFILDQVQPDETLRNSVDGAPAWVYRESAPAVREPREAIPVDFPDIGDLIMIEGRDQISVIQSLRFEERGSPLSLDAARARPYSFRTMRIIATDECDRQWRVVREGAEGRLFWRASRGFGQGAMRGELRRALTPEQGVAAIAVGEPPRGALPAETRLVWPPEPGDHIVAVTLLGAEDYIGQIYGLQTRFLYGEREDIVRVVGDGPDWRINAEAQTLYCEETNQVGRVYRAPPAIGDGRLRDPVQVAADFASGEFRREEGPILRESETLRLETTGMPWPIVGDRIFFGSQQEHRSIGITAVTVFGLFGPESGAEIHNAGQIRDRRELGTLEFRLTDELGRTWGAVYRANDWTAQQYREERQPPGPTGRVRRPDIFRSPNQAAAEKPAEPVQHPLGTRKLILD